MPVEPEKESALLRNLEDAGCPPDMIKAYVSCPQDEQRMSLLSKHRRRLLDEVHHAQRQLDCLDYLIYSIKKRGM